MDGIYELNQSVEDLYQRNRDLEAEVEQLKEMVFAQGKTIEGMQNLFIKAGEYKGKPRGRLPR